MLDAIAPALGDRELSAFCALLERHTGINYRKEKRTLLVSRLVPRLRQRGLSDFESYLALLNRPDERAEVMCLVDVLTTHETSFWREPAHFTYLQRHLSSMPTRPPNFRVWSCASSTGEEAFTLAMTLTERLPLGGFEIVGTDVSHQTVETARQGLYPMSRAAQIPDAMLTRWCRRGQGQWEGTFLIAKELRAHVKFQVGNLMVPQSALGKVDVAFLRNVLIYFQPAEQQNVIRNVVDRIKPGGLLFVGHSETAANLHPRLRVIEPSIYAVE